MNATLNNDIAKFNEIKNGLMTERDTIITRLREIDVALGRPAPAKKSKAAETPAAEGSTPAPAVQMSEG